MAPYKDLNKIFSGRKRNNMSMHLLESVTFAKGAKMTMWHY